MSEITSEGDNFYDVVPISGSIETSYETDTTKNIHTRVMIRDVAAAGYVTESATIASGTRFVSVDTEQFDKQLDKTYHDFVTSGDFITDIYSYYNSENHAVEIWATSNSTELFIAAGSPTDADFIKSLSKWGIAIQSPFGILYYRVANTRASSVQTIEISSAAEFASLCNANKDWEIEIGGVTISNTDIVGIDMPTTVNQVGNNFLSGCSNLTMEVDTSNLTSIGTNFMANCDNYNHPLDLSGITSLPNNFLYGCTEFNSALDISNVTTIGDNCLAECLSFNQPISAPNATSVGDSFLYCGFSFNNTVSLPSATSVGNMFLCDCSVLDTTPVLTAIATIGNWFLGNDVLFDKDLSLAKISNTGNYFLSGCTSFNHTLTLSNVLTVGDYFLADCESFNDTITLGKLTTVGSYFMSGCSSFNKNLDTSTISTFGMSFLYNCSSFNQSISLSGASSIASGFMTGCASWNQATVTIPATVSSFATPMFYRCDNMVGVYQFEAPASIIYTSTAIYDNQAFATNGQTPAYAQGISFSGTYAGEWARKFPSNANISENGRKITTSTYGEIAMANDSIIKIYSAADLQALTRPVYNWPAGSTHIQVEPDETVFEIGGQTYQRSNVRTVNVQRTEVTSLNDGFLINCTNLESFSLPDNITEFKGSFLANCTNFNGDLDLPAGLTEIGASFMYGCQYFNHPVSLPNGVTSIPDSFMRSCYRFNSALTLPQNLQNIGPYFLYECHTFDKNVTVPNSVTEIPNSFMYYCQNFNSTLILPNAITRIGNAFMAYCSKYNQPMTIPNTVLYIGTDFMVHDLRFNSSLTISNNIIEIGGGFIHYCSAFNQNITIPASLSLIGSYFMANCDAMTSTVTVNASYKILTNIDDNSLSTILSTTNASAAMATTGFSLAGDEMRGWGEKLQTRTSTPYRRVSNYYGYVQQYTDSSYTDTEEIILTSQADVNSLSWSGTTYDQTSTVDGKTITNGYVKKVSISATATSVPNYFLGYSRKLSDLAIPDTLTSMGDYFLTNCISFNQGITIPSPITTLPNKFMFECHSFNSPLNLNNVTVIGQYFLHNATSFNQTLNVTNITEVGTGFLEFCEKFNKALNFTSLTKILGRFMCCAFAYNQNTTIPASVTYIGGRFMQDVEAMCKTVTFNCSPSVFQLTNDQKSLEALSQSAPAYTTGIYIGGPYRSQWLAIWPNTDRRKLR